MRLSPDYKPLTLYNKIPESYPALLRLTTTSDMWCRFSVEQNVTKNPMGSGKKVTASTMSTRRTRNRTETHRQARRSASEQQRSSTFDDEGSETETEEVVVHLPHRLYRLEQHL